jgi:acyl-CoA thioesterase
MTSTKEAVARTRAFLDAIPFNHLLGIQISRAHPDGVTLHCKVKKELLNSNKVLHGGVSASIADAAVGVAIQHRFAGRRAITTVELKVNYFRPVAEGTLFARARLLRVGSTLCIGQVDLTDDKKNLVGVAIVTYIFLDARGSATNTASDSIVSRGKE